MNTPKDSTGGCCPPPPCSAIPEWAATEIRETWKAAREAGGELQAFRIIERMVDRLGYGRANNNPPLLPNSGLCQKCQDSVFGSDDED